MLYLGFHIEINRRNSSAKNAHWATKIINIYDPEKQVSEEFCLAMIQYLYDEGFIEDRRTDVKVLQREYTEE